MYYEHQTSGPGFNHCRVYLPYKPGQPIQLELFCPECLVPTKFYSDDRF